MSTPLSEEPGAITHLAVLIGPRTAEALNWTMATYGVTVTDALRRVVANGYMITRKAVEDGLDVVLHGDGQTQDVIFDSPHSDEPIVGTPETGIYRSRQSGKQVTASRWFKQGDHPDDQLPPVHKILKGERTEGAVVQAFQSRRLSAPQPLGLNRQPHNETTLIGGTTCHALMYRHGWLPSPWGEPGSGFIVCPGNWVVTNDKGLRFVAHDQLFHETYELA